MRISVRFQEGFFFPLGQIYMNCCAREDLAQLKMGLVAAVPCLQWR